MLRIVVARSPGRAAWARNATVAAPISTRAPETRRAPTRAQRSVGRFRPEPRAVAARLASVDEVGVMDAGSSLRVLLPHVAQVGMHRERREAGVETDRQGAVGDVLLGLGVQRVLLLAVRGGVRVEDDLGELVVVVER